MISLFPTGGFSHILIADMQFLHAEYIHTEGTA
jgi:hypothetical protein